MNDTKFGCGPMACQSKGGGNTSLKRGHIILIVGAALFVAGIVIAAIWAISFGASFVRDNTIVARSSIGAGQSVSAKTDVNQLDRPISLAIAVDKSGQSAPSEIRLKEVVTDPSGKIVSNNEFADGFFTSFKPEIMGTYTVTVLNLGTRPVTVSGTFGYMSFMGPNGSSSPDVSKIMSTEGLGVVIIGGGLASAGVIVLIVGAIVTVIDSRKRRESTTSTTTEGGVTYRKD